MRAALKVERFGLQVWVWLVVAAGVLVLAVSAAFGAFDGGEEDGPSRPIEAMRVSWNSLSSSERAAICADVDVRGVTAVAFDVNDAADETFKIADVSWFLETLACD